MKVGYEVLGKGLPLDCQLYIPITWCLNCNEPISNERGQFKEYCCKNCKKEHDLIMKYTLED